MPVTVILIVLFIRCALYILVALFMLLSATEQMGFGDLGDSNKP